MSDQQLTSPSTMPSLYFDETAWEQMDKIATRLIESKSLPSGIVNAAQLLMIFQAGHELNMKPMESLNNLYIVNGRVAMQGSAMLKIMARNGVKIEWAERSPTKVKAIFKREGFPDFPAEYTMAEADSRKVSHTYKDGEWKKKAVWGMFPENMLMWKVVAIAWKFYCSDLAAGMEMVEDVVDANVIDVRTDVTVEEKIHQPLLDKIAKVRTVAGLKKLESEVTNPALPNNPKKELVAAYAKKLQELGDVDGDDMTESEKEEAKKHAEDAEEPTPPPAKGGKLQEIFGNK